MDDLCVGGELFAQGGVLAAQTRVRVLGRLRAVHQRFEHGRDVTGVAGPAAEFFSEVGALMGEDPSLNTGFGGD